MVKHCVICGKKVKDEDKVVAIGHTYHRKCWEYRFRQEQKEKE